MENGLRPRDIQARIRSGRSVADVVAASGLPEEQVQRFAAPVLAEREFVAGQALAAPARRRGEHSGQRSLKLVVSEKLFAKRIDVDRMRSDAARMEDGRWAITLAYSPDEDESQKSSNFEAMFVFDPRGRFSVAGDPTARWLIGEIDEDDMEPTVGISEPAPSSFNPPIPTDDREWIAQGVASPTEFRPSAGPSEPDTEVVATDNSTPTPDLPAAPPTATAAPLPATGAPSAGGESPAAAGRRRTTRRPSSRTRRAKPTGASKSKEKPVSSGSGPATEKVSPAQEVPVDPGGLDVIFDILDRSGTEYTEDSVEVITNDGLDETASDAAAVPTVASVRGGPDIGPHEGYPVEPSLFDAAPPPGAATSNPTEEDPPQPESIPAGIRHPEEVDAATGGKVAGASRSKSKPRAAVPSWDEIMFGSPRPKSK